MPKVPSYENFQVQPTVLPGTKLTGALTAEQATVTSRQLEQSGNAIQRAASDAAMVQSSEMDRANALRVSDAKNKAKELEYKLRYDKQTGYTNLRGVDALQRPDGKPMADEYAEKYQKGIGEITDTLGNDRQKEDFTMHANNSLTDFHGQAMAYEGQEFKTYSMSVHDGTIKNATNDIGLNYNNPEAIGKSIEEIKAAAYEAARIQNKSAAFAEGQARDFTSKAHLSALDAAMQKNDPTYADKYLKQFAKDMNADDILKAEGTLTKQMDSHIALSVVDKVMNQASPTIETSSSDRAFNVAVGTESGGRQFAADGQPLTSPKGAIGVAQVMPATAPEAAKLAGIEWNEELYKTDASYNYQLGKAYFDQQLKDFGGNLAQAYSAYNAGPGRTRQAIAEAEKSGGVWTDYVPEETQNYVTKNMSEYEGGKGQNTMPTLEEVKAQVRAEVGSSRPERLKLALAEAENRYSDKVAATKQKNEATVATAMREVINNGGKYAELSPELRASLPPSEVDNIMTFAERIAKGDDTTSEALYQKLSDPNILKSYSEDQFFALRTELSQSDFKHFSNERNKILTGNVTNGPGELNTAAIKSTLDERMRTMGLDPSPKDGSDAAMRVGAIRKFVNESIATSQVNIGKKMTDTEVSQHIDGLLAKTATYDKFFGDSSGQMLGMKPKDIPSNAKSALKVAFKTQGISDPTDGQLLDAYWRGISRKQ